MRLNRGLLTLVKKYHMILMSMFLSDVQITFLVFSLLCLLSDVLQSTLYKMMFLVHEFILIHTLVEVACIVMNPPVLIVGWQ